MNTSNSLTDELLGQLRGAPMQSMAQQLGMGSAETERAVGTALPMLLGALGNNASQPQGAMDLFGALQRDHMGAAGSGNGLGGMLGGVLGGLLGGQGQASQAPASNGASILGHIFGGRQQQAESGLGQATGLGSNAGQLLQMLAPIVMAFLAQRVQSGGMDAGGLGQVLGREKAQVQQQGGAAGGLLSSLLDQNGDGKLDVGDLFKLGAGFLGGRR
ncbi:DUF937 domain-containing protein [Comamonas endophytica]|uniref:DUF937 domain-containing protein n=1 Tax=Comamonas endophytica TaxID=2949090 RepID=A0ABY6G827_9BURK|nr:MULTISPECIES: DUF937 domain-containing protein [unclassified Acidovorax]MCD2511655.1 DUF937 domain-containing protein [Acidovorax sp. D4N7]UYG51036.1 DUF937 domain-containing protein [Acidovorax sp. 5MLIR]